VGIIKGDLNQTAPIYVTRKNADGYIGSYSASLWMPIFTMLLFFTNAFIWGVVGIVYGIQALYPG
jgi:hypothetical protein